MTRIPDLFIVGAPKSGTTSLYEYLKGHPQIFMSAVKEPNYFARDLAEPTDNMLHHGTDWERYLALFADADATLRAGEASVRYLYSRDAPTLIHDVRPDAHIVAVLRNPVDMAHSLYTHFVAGGAETLTDFEQAVAAEPDRHAGRGIPPRMNPHLSTYTDRARYGEQLPRWLDVFGPERVHVIVFEEFITNPAVHFRALLEFLGVDAAYQPTEFAAHNVAHAARSPLVRGALNTRPAQWLAWHALPRLIGDRRSRALVQRFRHSRLHRQPIERAPLPAQLRERLERQFAPDVARLSELLGRDMGRIWFGQPSPMLRAGERRAVPIP